jgi:hypothetical protein
MLVAAAATGQPGPERDRRRDQRGECAVKNERGGGRGGARCEIGALERKVD